MHHAVLMAGVRVGARISQQLGPSEGVRQAIF